MELIYKVGIGIAAAGVTYGLFSLFSSESNAATQAALSAAAAKKGQADGCAQGTSDGKANLTILNPDDPSSNPTLAAAAKASGDPVTYLAEYGKAYDSCFAAAAPAAAAAAPTATKAKVAMDCSVMSTWPSDVQTLWNEYQIHKGDAAGSDYASSGHASTLYSRFVTLGCSGNAATVQATIQAWINAGGVVTGGPSCSDDSTWPPAIANAYKLYLADPYGFVAGGGGPSLVDSLASIGCGGTAAAVQHTIDLGPAPTAPDSSEGDTDTGAIGTMLTKVGAVMGMRGRRMPRRLHKATSVGSAPGRRLGWPSRKVSTKNEIIYASY